MYNINEFSLLHFVGIGRGLCSSNYVFFVKEFCKLEKSKEQCGSSTDDERSPGTSDSSMTDSDKAGEATHQTRNNPGKNLLQIGRLPHRMIIKYFNA